MPPKPANPTVVKNRQLKTVGLCLLLPICLVSFIVGIIGIVILLDEDGSKGLSQTEFAKLYKRLIAWNPFFSAFFFNGGMIGSMFCVAKLLEYRRAAKAAPPPVAAAGGETKKTK